ncbi:ATP-binding protein [Tenacibaculum sp. ZS6-P6]|uniref:ATP-binding protein n=1 Tax=Tenacibaculum sp. ZS6-P6 TaxID=3447503 RepID=UPI003F9DF9F2
MILPLSEMDLKDEILEVKVNLLIGKILNKYVDSREASQLYKLTKGIEHHKASYYLEKSLETLKSLNDLELGENIENKRLLAQNYLSLSKFYIGAKRKDSTEYYAKKVVGIESFDNEVLDKKARAYLNLGIVNVSKRDLITAEEMFLKSVEINEKLLDEVSLVRALNNLANIYLEKQNYKEAKKIYAKAIKYLENQRSLEAVQNKEMIYENFAWTLYKLKDYTAYEFVTESYEIRDSLKERELKKEIDRVLAENDVKVVQQKADQNQLKQKQKTWAVGTAGVVISILLLYLANLYKLRQRNLSLKLSQNELRQQRKLERLNSQAQVKILNATLDGKETERKQIAEILHDNVSALLSSANMHLEATQKQYGDNIPEELQKTQQIITEASEKIRDLSHNLVSSVLLKFGLEYAIKDVAKKFSNSEIKISTAISNVYRYSQDFEIKVFNIIQELINNILKHSKAKNAYIMLEEEGEMINLIVKDDGIGFEQAKDEDVGIGLNQIKARINMMNGNFFIESSKGNGTKVIASIPLVRIVRKKEMASA